MSEKGQQDMSSTRKLLTPDQKAEICRRYAAGGVSQHALAAQYGVSATRICRIIHDYKPVPSDGRDLDHEGQCLASIRAAWPR